MYSMENPLFIFSYITNVIPCQRNLSSGKFYVSLSLRCETMPKSDYSISKSVKMASKMHFYILSKER